MHIQSSLEDNKLERRLAWLRRITGLSKHISKRRISRFCNRAFYLGRDPATSLKLPSMLRNAAVSIGLATAAGWPRPGTRGEALVPPILSRSSTVALRSAVMVGRPVKVASIEPSSGWPFSTKLPL